MSDQLKGVLYMIPCYFHESQDPTYIIPPVVKDAVLKCQYFVVEERRTARRFLRKIGYQGSLDDDILFELNKHTPKEDISSYLNACLKGLNIGMISEAGCPGIADPGADLAKIAHQRNIRVVPLPGPSSVLLALMASGMNGQSFCFHGYIPLEKSERLKKIRQMETSSKDFHRSEIFMDTPFRNKALLDDILATCNPNTLLSIGCDLTMSTEFCKTKRISEWKNNIPDIQKRPAIFILYTGN